MKMLFLQDVPGTAKAGEIKEVREGYGRNFLAPRGIAVEASPANIGRHQQNEKRLDAKKKKRRMQAEELRDALGKASITIPAKAGQDDKLFGAVTSEDIVQAIKEQLTIEIDKHQIHLEQPIKKLGIYKVPVRLSADIDGEAKVWVVGEK